MTRGREVCGFFMHKKQAFNNCIGFLFVNFERIRGAQGKI